MTTPSSSSKAAMSFKEKLKADLEKSREGSVKTEEEIVQEVMDDFEGIEELTALASQVMFSELFFDPAEIGQPDFPVNTYHHLHEEWDEWVLKSVPESDPNYVWNKEATYDFVVADDEPAFLVGDPGTGKTSLPKEVCAIVGRPMFKQSFSAGLEEDEWIASKEITESGTVWDEKGFVKCMEFPFYCVLDEFNRLPRGGRLKINRLRDNGDFQTPAGREIKPHREWRMVATDNTRGLGDGLDKFDGDVADISTLDGFGTMIEVDYLPLPQQCELVQAWYPQMKRTMVDDIVKFGDRVVTAYRRGELPLPWTPRRMNKAGKLTLRYRNPVKALRSSYFNFLADDAHKQLVNQFLKDVGIDTKYGDFFK